MRCSICNRPITAPLSIARGIGSVCWKKLLDKDFSFKPDKDKHHITEGDFKGTIILSRRGNQSVVNIHQIITKHSPNGFEWGYGGSGPSDLALNILIHFTTPEVAQRLYQQFKWEFISRLPYEGGEIKEQVIRDWINKNYSPLFPEELPVDLINLRYSKNGNKAVDLCR